jgi:hypothetical protein
MNLTNKTTTMSIETTSAVAETTNVNVQTTKDAIAAALAAMTPAERMAIYPPKVNKNFVVRKSWKGRNQIITFTNKKGKTITYDHDTALAIMEPKLSIMPCWIKRGYWSQSTDLPVALRGRIEIENLEEYLASLVAGDESGDE